MAAVEHWFGGVAGVGRGVEISEKDHRICKFLRAPKMDTRTATDDLRNHV